MTMFVKLGVYILSICSLFTQGLCCHSGWMTHGSSCYHFSHDTESWIGALQFCREMMGHLVEINDADENAFIKAEAKLRKRKLLT
ncbi:perlucin-like protein [Ruditapes philippinarum]|uniref:perlucin-like protein n=1 Tax=Ruditapes philippinarum TaxID=129788 RepID=UPI00295C2F4B|nr:perlucin-like protein [Ruditapes philippinarum]